MIVFDILSELESYQNSFKSLKHVISLLDRSIPYKQGEGVYTHPEEKSLTYRVCEVLTSSKGFKLNVDENKQVLVMTLDNEMSISRESFVYKLIEGQFIILSEGEYKVGLAVNNPTFTKYVLFEL